MGERLNFESESARDGINATKTTRDNSGDFCVEKLKICAANYVYY